MAEGRVYDGGGVHKLEPRELGNVLAQKILESLPELLANFPPGSTVQISSSSK